MLGCTFLVCLRDAGAEGVAVTEITFERPDPSLVRQTTREILSDPEFRPHETFWQWLARKLFGWGDLPLDFASGWVKAFAYILLAWCILALLAILINLIWFLIRLTVGRFSRPHRALGSLARDADAQLTYGELKERAEAFAQQGAYREAAASLLRAVFCWLDDAGLLSVHESKTNGDYLREFEGPVPVRSEFHRLVHSVEHMTYGGAPCTRAGYQHLNHAAKQVCSDVERQPQV